MAGVITTHIGFITMEFCLHISTLAYSSFKDGSMFYVGSMFLAPETVEKPGFYLPPRMSCIDVCMNL